MFINYFNFTLSATTDFHNPNYKHPDFSGCFFYAQKTPYYNGATKKESSVSKIFDYLGLTKPLTTSKVQFFYHLGFYLTILGNVLELTTFKKKAQSTALSVSKMVFNRQKKHCQLAFFWLNVVFKGDK